MFDFLIKLITKKKVYEVIFRVSLEDGRVARVWYDYDMAIDTTQSAKFRVSEAIISRLGRSFGDHLASRQTFEVCDAIMAVDKHINAVEVTDTAGTDVVLYRDWPW